MGDVAGLLLLPLETLVVLGSGYLGYRIAYIGHDGPHGPADVVFLSFAFAAIAKATAMLAGPWGHLGLAAGPIAAILAAVAWRIWGGPLTFHVLRRFGVSDHDRGRDVWESMLMRRLKDPTRIVVVLKDGRQLMSDDISQFRNLPLGPCLFGPDGSVALYVTDTRKSSDEDWVDLDIGSATSPSWGYAMTFVPASEIARVRIMRPV